MNRSLALIILLPLMLLGCTPFVASESLPTQRVDYSPMPSSSIVATAHTSPARIPMDSKRNSDESVVVVSPSTKPLPTATVTPTVTKTPDAFQLPSWLCDASLPVLLTHMDEPKIHFINPAVGEDFSIPVPGLRGYFWMEDGLHFGFWVERAKHVSIVDACSGSVENYQLSPRANEIISAEHSSQSWGVQAGDPGSPQFLILKRDDAANFLSASGKYEVLEDINGDDQISVKDLSNDHISDLTAPARYPIPIDWAWAPKGDRLAVLWSDTQTGHMVLFGSVLQLYDPEHETIRTIAQENLRQIRWSPDGNRIVYQKGAYHYQQGACIVDLDPLKRKCFFPEDLFDQEVSLSQFHWLHDNRSLSYLYYLGELVDPQTGEHYSEGGLCVVDDNLERNFCPTDNIPELDRKAMILYHQSPDDSYYLILYDRG